MPDRNDAHAPPEPTPAETARDRFRAWLTAAAAGLAVTLAVGAAVAGVWTSTSHMARDNHLQHLSELATVAAQRIDPVQHRELRRADQLDDPEYCRVIAPLRRITEAVPDIRRVYTFMRDGDQIRVVLDTAPPRGGHGRHSSDRHAPGEVLLHTQAAQQLALGWNSRPGTAATIDHAYETSQGIVWSGFAPLRDATGRQFGAIGVDMDASLYLDNLATARRLLVLGLLPATVLILVVVLTVYRVRLRDLQARRETVRAATSARDAARRDKLTGLANRTLFMERLERAITRAGNSEQSCFAVLFLDFDRFKLVNDTLGHDTGDELLCRIADRLRSTLRVADSLNDGVSSNVVARFGGDEFVVLINELHSAADAETVANRLLQALAPVYRLKAGEVHSSASIGVVVGYDGADNAETIVRNADVAMYEAKHSGRGCFVVFNDAMHERLTRRVAIEHALRRAIGTPDLGLAYQPILDVENGRMVAVEALLRWQHPTLGDLSPAEFVPIAEEGGLIGPLSDWVLRAACEQLAVWRREFPERAPATVCVNLSRAEVAAGGRLVTRVQETLAEVGLPAQCLQLEVSERHVVRDPGAAGRLMQQLHGLGVRLLMDDFGTGASSLVSLRDFAFDAVKINRSCVVGIATSSDVMALVHATLTLVENLGMTSMAVGVEDAAQLAILQSLGCRYAQGIFLARPMSPAELRDRFIGAPAAGEPTADMLEAAIVNAA